MKEIINCLLFDGTNLINNVEIIVEQGIITSLKKNINNEIDCFVMPCLIDSHTHIIDTQQINQMINYGINMALDVCASPALIESSKDLQIISSVDMILNPIFNPKKYVEKAIKKGAKYIKVLLFNSHLISLNSLKELVEQAHIKNLKVVVHATEIATYQKAIQANVDIILHLPMKDELTDDIAKMIAQKNIYVVPTLVMMETFAKNQINGYKASDFTNALKQVNTLYQNGVKILVGTDSNIGSFAPKVSFGDSIYREIELLENAKIPIIDILKGTSSLVLEAFNIEFNYFEIGKPANFLMFKTKTPQVKYERLDKIWMNKKQIK